MKRTIVSIIASLVVIPAAVAQSDGDVEAAVYKALRAYEIQGVQISVESGVVTLSGKVDRCLARLDALQMTSRIRGVQAIADKIRVVGPRIPDERLRSYLEKMIAERTRQLGGFGFGSVAVGVRDGVVTLSGNAARQLANPVVAAVAQTAGVKNLIDRVQIVPVYDTGWAQSGPAPGFH